MRKLFLMPVFLLYLLGSPLVEAVEPGSFFSDGPKDKKEIALTFDDGPGNYTGQVLAVLKKYDVKATFFMEGSQIEIRPAVARDVFAGGHEVGSHTFSHPNFYVYKKEDANQVLFHELTRTEKAFEKLNDFHPVLLRMPHGYVRPWVKEVAREKGYVLVNWTFGCDWNKMTGEEMAGAYIKYIRPGAIFLMHDGGKRRQPTLEALPQVIEAAKKQGYTFVTVSELLGLNGSNVASRQVPEGSNVAAEMSRRKTATKARH